jgi:hypothetical protein
MNVDALRILNQLPFLGLGVDELNDTGGDGKQLGQLSATVPPRSCDQLEAIRVGPHGDGLDAAVMPNALGLLCR